MKHWYTNTNFTSFHKPSSVPRHGTGLNLYMYMKHILTIFILLTSLSTKAQHQNDYNWILGYGILLPDLKQGGTRLSFLTDPPTQTYYEVPPDVVYCTGMISDSAGVLQFYTNGCQVFDTNYHLMQDGDSINYANGYIYKTWCEKEDLGYSTLNGLMVLPVPDSPKKYIIFHAWYGETDPYDLAYPVALLYTMVDMDKNNGLGAVVAKNQVLIQDTIGDMMAAVKHGNGRDWWIVNPSTNSDLVTLMLLTPEGIKGPYYHSTGVPWPVIYTNQQVSGAVFSPDGTKYAKAGTRIAEGAPAMVHVFDFDRCTGAFSCPKTYEIQDDPDYTPTIDVAFSPNSRFLYVTADTKIYQFDTSEKNLGSTKVLVGEYDGFWAPLKTTLYQLQLAPNGKIYVGASNGAHILHTIHNPDEKGLACRFINHDLELLTKNGLTLPTFPNFRLYDWEGSPCDTLGINAPNDSLLVRWAGHESIRISPNPANQFTLMTVPSCKNGTITVFDAIGRLVYEQKGVFSNKTYDINVSDWPAGVYFAVVRDGTRAKVVATRLVVVH
jgi:Secretion system C-terminal sorting domain